MDQITVDGREICVPEAGTSSLWDVLDEAGARVPFGCGTGHCGACTVLVDDEPAPSCLVPKAAVAGADISTANTSALGVLAGAMALAGAVQCGFCSPGIVVTLSWAIRGAHIRRKILTESEIRDLLVGHLCRCTGYQAIVDAAVCASRQVLIDSESEPLQ